MPLLAPEYDFEATMRFVDENQDCSVSRIAFLKTPEGVDRVFALNQIHGRQYAKLKLPSWAKNKDVVYPKHISFEQCSSETTARYKAGLIGGDTIVDLTGGFGVDSAALAARFKHVTYVEAQPELCEIARHNFSALDLNNIDVVNARAEDFLATMPAVDAVFLDPSRRDTNGQRVFLIKDCSPDVEALMPQLLEKAATVMVKFSPMLDITNVTRALSAVEQVHVVSVKNECKELLVLARRGFEGAYVTHCVNDDQHFSFTPDSATHDYAMWDGSSTIDGSVLYLYDPNASVMKAGCFAEIAEAFGVMPVSVNSHLFVSPNYVPDFPGRVFRLLSVTTFNRKDLKNALHGIAQANIAVRNFPMTAVELKKRLHLSDGGNTYIFATRLTTAKPLLLMGEKM